jgi:hypothetical protein
MHWKQKWPDFVPVFESILAILPYEDCEEGSVLPSCLRTVSQLSEELNVPYADMAAHMMLLELTGEVRRWPKHFVAGNEFDNVYARCPIPNPAPGLREDD